MNKVSSLVLVGLISTSVFADDCTNIVVGAGVNYGGLGVVTDIKLTSNLDGSVKIFRIWITSKH